MFSGCSCRCPYNNNNNVNPGSFAVMMLFAFRRLIVKLEVTPPDRLRTMNDMIRGVESRDVGPCGGFTTQYACMCDYHGLPYREEVAWVRSLWI